MAGSLRKKEREGGTRKIIAGKGRRLRQNKPRKKKAAGGQCRYESGCVRISMRSGGKRKVQGLKAGGLETGGKETFSRQKEKEK